MPTLYIDNKPYAFTGTGRNLLDVCLSLGFNLPYFCWHPALHSIGACRQCAIRVYADDKDTKGWLTMACMTDAKDGMRVSVDDADAVAFRRQVTEWLMANHPHDCPICDEGGECHLQDMTVMTGHTHRRYRFPKRTHHNQDLGPFVNHEMNRCIQCYRCVRFYRDYAGGRDFDVFGWHDHLYFGRQADGALESEFSGNLVEVCPTGVFTDKTLKAHYARKWDLQTAPSICVHCGLGCNTLPGERYGALRRVQARYHGEINGYFLCDRGRYGYEFVNSPRRLRQPSVKAADGSVRPVERAAALDAAAALLRQGSRVGIGSPRASLEANFALRDLVGADRFCAGLGDRDLALVRLTIEILRDGGVRGASLREVEFSDAVLILGEDPTNAAPMLDLALRQAALRKPKETAAKLGIPDWHDVAVREVVQLDRGPFFVATPDSVKLDDVATLKYRAAPDDIARLGWAVAHALDPARPAVAGLAAEAQEQASRIATALRGAKRPLVVAGTTLGSDSLLKAAASVAQALRQDNPAVRVFFVVPESNSIGLALMTEKGLGAVPATDTLVILDNDLDRRSSGSEALGRAKRVIAIDSLASPTAARADVALPAATFAEETGTLVNNEGRAQRYFQVFVAGQPVQSAWRWAAELASRVAGNAEPAWASLDDVLRAMEQAIPALRGVSDAAPKSDFRLTGKRVPRQSHRYTGRTAMTANLDIREPAPPRDADAPLAFSMEGAALTPPPELATRAWAPGWNSVHAINKFQIEVGSGVHRFARGVRLLEPSVTTEPRRFADVPPAFAGKPDELLVVAATHIFGSDDLSLETPGIAGLALKPYVGLGARDAERLGVREGQAVRLAVAGRVVEVAVRVRPALTAGVASVSVAGLELPAPGRIEVAVS